MGIINKLFDFLFNEERRLSQKATLILFVIVAIFFTDNYFGFSYHYNIIKRVEQIEKIDILLNKEQTDSASRVYLEKLKYSSINRVDVKTFVHKLLFERELISIPKSAAASYPNKPKVGVSPVLKNTFWFNVTSAGLYFLFGIVSLPIVLFTNKQTSFGQRFMSGALVAGGIWLIGTFIVFLFNLIPQIGSSSWTYNYLLNIILQFGIIWLSYLFSSKKN